MDIKAKALFIAEKEKKNHYIVNIMMVALLALIILFNLLGGVKLNVGSVYDEDGKDMYVRQNFFQVVDAAFSASMSMEEARVYVAKINKKLYEDFGGTIGLDMRDHPTETSPPFDGLSKVGLLAKEVEEKGYNPNKINWIKYKFAFSKAIVDVDSDNLVGWQWMWQSNWQGHRAVATAGQAVFVMLIMCAMVIISIVMLLFAVLALIKKKEFKKSKFALILLLMLSIFRIFFSFSLLKIDALGIITAAIVIFCVICYALLKHAMMEKHDFSFTMFVHNCVILAGVVLAFILLLCPMFKITDITGASSMYGRAYIYDFVVSEGAYMLMPMSYFLVSLLITVILMMPQVLCAVLLLTSVSRFMSADYQHNEKRVFLSILLVINLAIFVLLGTMSTDGGLSVTSLYLDVKLNMALVIIEPIIVAGMLVFEILYKVKPVKKELIIR